MLVTRFVLGLKEDLRAAVEIQMPTTVAMAATLAGVQEGVVERTCRKYMHMSRNTGYSMNSGKTEGNRKGNDPNHTAIFEKGELWKAKQLKEFRRSNGLCFKCGDKGPSAERHHGRTTLKQLRPLRRSPTASNRVTARLSP